MSHKEYTSFPTAHTFRKLTAVCSVSHISLEVAFLLNIPRSQIGNVMKLKTLSISIFYFERSAAMAFKPHFMLSETLDIDVFPLPKRLAGFILENRYFNTILLMIHALQHDCSGNFADINK